MLGKLFRQFFVKNLRESRGKKGSQGDAKTFIIDLPIMILFGVLFSLFASSKRQGWVFSDGFLWHCLIFATIFNVAVVYAIIHYPDWMWMYYLKDSTNTRSELAYLFVFLYYFPVIFGYYLGRDFKRVSYVFWFLLFCFLIAAEAWLVWRFYDRYSMIGTLDDFVSGNAKYLFGPENPIAKVMNGSVGVMFVYFILVIFLYRRQQKKMLRHVK